MPTCSNVVRLLVEYIENRLPDAARAALDAHLARCPACVTYVNTYRSTVSLLKSIGEEDLPAELRLSLHAFLDRAANN